MVYEQVSKTAAELDRVGKRFPPDRSLEALEVLV